MKDYIIRATAKDAPLRAFAVTTKEMVEEAKNTHNLTPLTSAALGRVLTATTLMGEMLKNPEDKLTLQFKGDGPAGNIIATGNAKGEVKGYINNPSVILPLNGAGKLDVGAAIGHGTLMVIMDMGLKEPYTGKVSLVNGEVAEDLTHYFTVSEQTPSAISLGVLVDRDRSIKASGGFIVQVLPDCPEEAIERLENNIKALPPITDLLAEGKRPQDIIKMIFKDFTVEISKEKSVSYLCDCNRTRLEKALISIGKEELWDMIEKEGKAELHCHFCNSNYHFSKEELSLLLEEAK